MNKTKSNNKSSNHNKRNNTNDVFDAMYIDVNKSDNSPYKGYNNNARKRRKKIKTGSDESIK